MSKNNDAPDSSAAAAPDAQTVPPADALRALLDAPKPKDEAWQSDAGRAVSLLAVRFLNEASEDSALRVVALLGLAQSMGVKEARKRSLKLTRWAEAAPPLLTVLATKDEQQAALAALSKLTAGWSRAYAERALADPSLPEELLPELLKWARATYADSLSFVHEFYAPRVAAAKSGERTAALLKEAGKLLKSGSLEAAANVAEMSVALVDALLQAIRPEQGDEKAFTASITTLLHLLQDQAAAAPAILVQPTFVLAFGRLTAATAKGAASKQVSAVADTLSLATISLLSADLERNGGSAAAHWNALVPTWRSAYVNWDASVAAAAKASPALLAIASAQGEDTQAATDTYATEAVFARLLPAWNAFVAELPDPGRAASLSAMLLEAAGSVGISPLGEQGAIVGFDPLSHQLAEEADGSPSQVRILRAGVMVRRPDGSARVLVTALVAAV